MSEDNKNKPINLEIQIDEATSVGQYVNLVIAQHSASEFVLDFVFIPPGQPKAKVRSRIILAPEHAKRLQMVLADNLKRFEQRFGEIKLPALPANMGMPTGSVQ